MTDDWDPDAPTEEASDYDGAFSYAAEWHAFSHGVYKGLTSLPLIHPEPPDNEDVEKESHYYRGGYVVGTLLQVMLMLVGYVTGVEFGFLPEVVL